MCKKFKASVSYKISAPFSLSSTAAFLVMGGNPPTKDVEVVTPFSPGQTCSRNVSKLPEAVGRFAAVTVDGAPVQCFGYASGGG